MKTQVVGAGSWGMALARLLALNGHTVSLWCHANDDPESLRVTRERPAFLPGIKLPESIEVVTETQRDVDMAVLAVPSHVMRPVAQAHRFDSDAILVNVAKGIENETLMTMDQVIADVAGPCTIVTLSGPSHAEEVARDLPATVVAASRDIRAAETVQAAFTSQSFRVYTSPDILGVELGGSLKNVIAIAAGVCDGFQLGDNARAALITRGLAEISRLGVAMGADPLTFAGLSGMGDLIVTCGSTHSRNHAVGERLAKGMSTEEAVNASPMVAEGVRTTKSARALAEKHNIEMPITEAVYQVLFENLNAKEAITQLMQRETKPERT